MIDGLQPYPDYAESGVPWLGHLPQAWAIHKLKRVATINPSKTEARSSLEKNENVTFLPMERVGTDGRTDCRDIVPASAAWNGFTYFRRSDVLIAKITPCFENGKGACLDKLPTAIGFGSTEFHVVRPNSDLLIPEYVYYFSMTPEFRRLGTEAMTGAAGQQRVPQSFISNFPIPIPPLHEQTAIVRFLDHADRLIRRYSRSKRRLINLLNEQKQNTVHEAVTRGLNPDIKLKPSGVGWLGEVPEHWSVASLRFRYDQCLGKMVDAKKATGKHLIPYLRNIDVRWGNINARDLPMIDIAPHERDRFTVRVGDLLVCEGRHLGRSAFWQGQINVCGFQKALHRLRPLDLSTDDPKFLFYCLYSAHLKDAYDASSTDTSIPHLTGEMLRAHRFPFPPRKEQTAIAEYLDEMTSAIDKAVATAQQEIALIREFQTRLIADIVTGQLDVRETATRLPDKTIELEAINETEDFAALDEDIEDEDVEDAVARAEA